MSMSQSYQYPFHNPANCVQTQLQYCQHSFNQYLGIATDADWRDPMILSDELAKRFYMGPEGLTQVCRANTLLYGCMGTTYWSCFNPLYLVGRGYGLSNSFQFSSEMLRTNFKCTGGMEQSINQWSCIGQAFNSSTAAVTTCVSAFNATLYSNPTYDAFCQATQTFMDCFSQLFFPLCGSTVQWWACEDIRVGFSLFMCPTLQCQVNSGGSKGMPIYGFGYDADSRDGSQNSAHVDKN